MARQPAYTDADVEAMAEALLSWRKRLFGSGGPRITTADLTPQARHVLDAVAPAIAARALRQTAGAIFNGATDPEQEFYDAGVSPWLMRRADEIEAGR